VNIAAPLGPHFADAAHDRAVRIDDAAAEQILEADEPVRGHAPPPGTRAMT
jgi:hypothetical protein